MNNTQVKIVCVIRKQHSKFYLETFYLNKLLIKLFSIIQFSNLQGEDTGLLI